MVFVVAEAGALVDAANWAEVAGLAMVEALAATLVERVVGVAVGVAKGVE